MSAGPDEPRDVRKPKKSSSPKPLKSSLCREPYAGQKEKERGREGSRKLDFYFFNSLFSASYLG